MGRSEASRCLRVQAFLTSQIARESKVIHYFEDYCDEEGALTQNQMVETLADSSFEERDGLVQEYADHFVDAGLVRGEELLYEVFAELWDAGIPIKYYKTEDAPDSLDVLELITGKVADDVYHDAKNYLANKDSDVEVLFALQSEISDLILAHRDTNV